MADTWVDDNGWTHTKKYPSQFVKELPNYGSWLKFCLSRGLARKTGTRKTATGMVVDVIEILSIRKDGIEQDCILTESEQVMFSCVCCGLRFTQLEMTPIVVGGIIQMPYEDQIGHLEMEQGIRPMPVQHKGLGCKACGDKFLKVMGEVASTNKAREEINLLRARLAQATGNAAPKSLGMLTPFINIYEEDIPRPN